MFEHVSHAKGAVGRGRRLRNAMTPSEQRLWKALRKLAAHIRRQAPIGPYIVDFACHGRSLVVEVDGEVHERLDEVVLKDFERSEWLRSQGYRVVRFTNKQVDADVAAVVREIEHHLALPLDGEGLGWGESADAPLSPESASAPNGRPSPTAIRPPRSPTLSPSRGKGA
jgi:very-short-patch-repair endonuclease